MPAIRPSWYEVTGQPEEFDFLRRQAAPAAHNFKFVRLREGVFAEVSGGSMTRQRILPVA
jgi:hypothetical protein